MPTSAAASTIPRSLYVAMVVQFAVGGAVVPFVTLLLRDRGLNFSQISQIFLAASSTLLVFPFLWAMLADRFIPMNRMFTWLNLIIVSALAAFAFQKSFVGLLVTFTSFSAGFSPSLTLINALSFHHLQSPREQFGLLRSWGSIGWIVPSLPISLWLAFGRRQELDFVLYLGIGISLVMVIVTLFLPHTPPGGGTTIMGRQPVGYWPAIHCLMRDPNYLTILVSFFLMIASFSIMTLYSPPFLEDRGVPRLWIGPVQCIGVLLEVLLFQFRSILFREWSYASTILLGCFCLVLRQLLFAFSDNPWLLSSSYLLAGMVIVFYHVGSSVLVNTIAAPEVRATAQALLVFFGSGMGPLIANGIAGSLATHFNQDLRPVFMFAAALAALAFLLIATRRAKLDEAAHGELARCAA